MATQEITLRFRGDAGQLRSVNQQVRQEITQTAQTQKVVSQGELSMRQQLSAAASLQRQRSAALISEWKKQEAAAKSLASGIKPVGENLQTVTNIMRTLGSSVGVLQGPLNGISGRLTSFGTLARSAGDGAGELGTAAATMGGRLAAAAGPIGILIAGVGALAAASVVLTKGLFDMAVAAAEFRGKMFDMAQQTGVAVETLSTLEIAAATTGGSIDSIAQSVVIFQGHLDDAQDSASKMGIKFKELGISTNNTEDALRDALAQLAKMPVGFDQTNTAAELFGRRGGKQMLAILKELDGDLPGATAKLRQLGLVISEEDARAADEFNDQLAILQFQFRAMLGQDVIPAALIALKAMSSLVSENKEVFIGLGQVIGMLSNVILGQFLQQLNNVNIALGAMQVAAAFLDNITGTDTRFRGLSSGVGSEDRLGGLASGAGGVERGRGGGRAGRAGGGQSEAERALKQQIEYTQQLYTEVVKLADELSGVDTSTRAYAVSQAILNGTLKDASSITQQIARDAAKTIDETLKQIKLSKELTDFQEAQNVAVRLAIEGEDTYAEAAERLIISLEKQGKILSVNEIFWLKFNASILQAATAMERLNAAQQESLFQAQGDLGDGEVKPGFEGDVAGPVPPPVPIEVIDSWTILKEASMDAISSMAQGIGDLVHQWVLYGTAGPNAVRKMIAAVLAAAAAQAAVEAVMQLAHAAKEYAMGLAAASNPFTAPLAAGHFAAASAHLSAAAMYGAVAGVAAVSGRVIAGNSFNETTKASTGGRSGGGGSSEKPATKEVDRRQNMVVQFNPTIVVKGEATEGFRYMVEKVAVQSVRDNGPFRKIQNGENV